jgi:hypothetical protein
MGLWNRYPLFRHFMTMFWSAAAAHDLMVGRYFMLSICALFLALHTRDAFLASKEAKAA